MRKLLAIALLVITLATPLAAGDVNGPPSPEPPPCTENCGGRMTIIQSLVVLAVRLTR